MPTYLDMKAKKERVLGELSYLRKYSIVVTFFKQKQSHTIKEFDLAL